MLSEPASLGERPGSCLRSDLKGSVLRHQLILEASIDEGRVDVVYRRSALIELVSIHKYRVLHILRVLLDPRCIVRPIVVVGELR